MKAFLHIGHWSVPVKRHFPLGLLLTVSLAIHAQTYYYVKPTATGSGNGSSWVNAAGSGQLQTIINAAVPGGQVWVAAGTYIPNAVPVGSSGGSTSSDYAFNLVNGVAVYGGFAGGETLLSQRNVTTNPTILSGNNISYHVVLSAGNSNTAILDGFTIKNANASNSGRTLTFGGQQFIGDFGAGIYCMSSSAVLSNCIITNNTAYSGGGVYNRSSPGPTFTNCTFSGNTATSTSDGGGASYNYSGSALTFTGCTFSNNSASGNDGGAGYGNGATYSFTTCTFSNNSAAADGGVLYGNNGANFTVNGCAFNNNTAAGSGGAIIMISSSPLTISGSSFVSNRANSTTLGGGAIYINSNPDATISNCSFTSNSAAEYGGGFLGNNGGNGSVMSYCTFSSNSAVYGGGMANIVGSAPTVKNCKFSNGSATYGAGVYDINGSPIFSYDTLANNTATGTSGMGGGGMCNDASANPVISHCWFSGNVTNGADGAGLWDNSSGVDSNTVFQANIAKGSASNGGGVYHNSSSGSIINCVFVNNSAVTDGGGYFDNGTGETLENCTLYNNTAAAGAGIYEAGGAGAKYYGDIAWGNTPDGFAIGAGANGGLKVKYNDFQNTLSFSSSTVVGNLTSDPLFELPGTVAGADGIWATADDGLHLKTTSPAVNYDPSNYPGDDIADAIRPYTGNTNANVGAYEGPGTFITLAVELFNFMATAAANNTVNLSWNADAGGGTAQYQVQRSVNGTDFAPIGTADAVAGQTAYRFSDVQAVGAVLYYRVQIIVADAGEGFSATVIVRNALQPDQWSLRPSVVSQGTTTLYIGVSRALSVSLMIVDASGSILSARPLSINQGDNYIPLDVSGLARGVYYVFISGDSGLRKTMMLEKF